MSVWLLLGSLGGVLGLAAIARLLGLGDARLTDEAEAMAIAEAEMPGFVAARAVLCADGAGATVSDVAGQALRLRRHGAHFVIDRSDG